MALLRVLAFYLTALVLLLSVGSALQYTLGLTGVVLSQLLIFVGLPLAFTAGVERRPVRPFLRLRMLTLRGLGRSVLLGLVGWAAAQLMGAVLILAVQQMGGRMVQTYQMLLDAGSTLALLVGALVPAICEELSFRGYVLGALRSLGPSAAVVLTGLLFGALHLSLVRLVPLTLLGMLWALAVQRSGSILPGMIMHLINNGTALLLTFFVQDRASPADLQGLEVLPDAAVWSSMAVLTLAAAGLSAVAYILAAGFSPRHLARPAETEIEWDWQAEGREKPSPLPEALAAAADGELERLAAEAAALRKRRRRMLSAASLLTGGVTVGIFLWAAMKELEMVFS
nr:MAG: hypothetical protein DIU55_07790 [Bacillota bacterium]